MKKEFYKSWPFIFGLVVVSWLSAAIYFGMTERSLGTYGDAFGSLNALFSGLAFAGLIYTLLLQQEEIRLQRKDLKLTQQTLQDQEVQLGKQSKALNLQNFYHTFFSLIDRNESFLEICCLEVKVGISGLESYKGNDTFDALCNQIQARFEFRGGDLRLQGNQFLALRRIVLSRLYSASDGVHRYLFYLHQLAQYIVDADIAEAEKKTASNILGATLSPSVIAFIFYVRYSGGGEQDAWKTLEEEWNFFEVAVAKKVPVEIIELIKGRIPEP